jgi:chemotaxis protein CheX
VDTILLINDSQTLTKILKAHFRKAGFQVIAVTGVMEAYEAFIRNEVHLILTDYVLRDKDGPSAIETFRARKSHATLPIVVFTALDDPKIAEECTAAGADLVVAKKNDTAEILSAIERLIDEYKQKSMPSSSIDTDMGNCIVKSTTDVFRTMMELKAVPGEIKVEKAQSRRAEVIGSLGVAGFLSGSISVFLTRGLAKLTAAKMLMLDESEELADEELTDAIGELTNMIGGNIKTELFKKTPLFDISVPSVYIGDDLQRRTVADDLCFHVPFTCGEYEFSVEFLMITRERGGTGVQGAILGGMSEDEASEASAAAAALKAVGPSGS